MVTIRLPDDLRDAIDAVRGDVPRERWVRRTLEMTLADPGRPWPVVVENLKADGAGRIVPVDPSKPVRYEEKRPPSTPRPALPRLPAFAPGSARPQRHEFSSGEEWQAAVRAWKEQR